MPSTATWPRLSDDGRYLTGNTGSSTFVYDRFAATSHYFSPPAGARWISPALSGNGRYVVFFQDTTSAVIVAPNPLNP